MPPTTPAAEKIVPTSLKLPASVKAQIDETARKSGMSAHAFMVQTLSTATENAQLREQFDRDSVEALKHMDETGLGHELADVRAYFDAMAAYRRGQGPRPARLIPTKVI